MALLTLLLLMGCSTAAAQNDGPIGEPVIAMRVLHHLHGVALWDCREAAPVAFVNLALLDDPVQFRITAAHEVHHLRTMRSFGSCAAWQRWQRRNMAMSEAMAYCAAAEEAERAGYGFQRYLHTAAWKMAKQYPFGLTLTEARALILTACRDPLYLAIAGGGP